MTKDPVVPRKIYSPQHTPATPLARAFAAAECHTQTELAELLGIRQSSVCDAKKRRAVPAEWLVKLLRLKNVNPEWILTGTGPKHLGPARGEEPPAPVVYLTRIRPPQECSAQELITELVLRAMADI